MNTIEFTLWLNGAVGVLGDAPPTAEQWDAIKGKLGEAVGAIVARRLLETADVLNREREAKQAAEVSEKEQLRRQMQLLQQKLHLQSPPLVSYPSTTPLPLGSGDGITNPYSAHGAVPALIKGKGNY